MISLLRSAVAFVLAGILTLLTLGKVDLNRTGRSRFAGDDDGF